MSADHDRDRLLDPAHLVGLAQRPLDEVRSLRRECLEYETGLSYLRRRVQGSIDIIEGELERRAGGAADTSGELVDALPGLLADSARPPGLGRLTASLEPVELDHEAVRRYEALVGGGDVAHVTGAGVAELHQLLRDLQDIEREVSHERHAFHNRIDALQAELTRRYRTGEASVDSLLGST
jgi:hypothetical protein